MLEDGTFLSWADPEPVAEPVEFDVLDGSRSDEIRRLRDDRSTLRAAFELMEEGVVFLDERDRIVLLNSRARQSLLEHADEQPHGGQSRLGRGSGIELPSVLTRWLARHREQARFHGRIGTPPPEQITLEGPVTRLIVRLAGSPCPGQRLLLIQRQPTHVLAEELESLGLTVREAEVLAWVLQGKSNPEIAMILDLSPRTVGKHLERVYRAMGVENRISACLLAMEHLKRHSA